MAEPLVHFQDATVIRNGRTALSGINLKIDAGESVAILGPNGSGKSSMVKVMAGDLRVYAGKGEVTIRGLRRWNLFELRSILGIVSNELQADCKGSTKGLDLVLSGYFGSYGSIPLEKVTQEMVEHSKSCLDMVEAGYLADRSFEEMSSGEMRRVLIARALVHRPQALLLDEPTTSLDMRASHEFLETVSSLARRGTAVILVTHYLEDIVPEIGRVVLLKNGKVFCDGRRDEVLSEKNISELFDMPVKLTGSNRVHATISIGEGED